jgi:hypothetical protein
MNAEEFSGLLPHPARRRGNSGWWDGRCPAHHDEKDSLSFRDGDVALILKCQAGCPRPAIASSVGLSLAELRLNNGNGAGPRRKTPVAEYSYRDAGGIERYRAVRYDPKDFRQCRRDASGELVWNMNGVQRIPYRLNELAGHETVVIVEGEKDCDRLWSLGIPSTTNVGGAGKWKDRESAALVTAGVKQVVLIPDNDDSGENHGQSAAASCYAAGLRVAGPVRLSGLPPRHAKHGEDVSDWLDVGHTAEELRTLLEDASQWTPPVPYPNGNGPWSLARPVTEFVRDVDAEVQWLEEPLLAPGSLTQWFSPRGLGKTHSAYAIAVKLARSRVRILLLDRDNSRREIRRRLAAWGAGDTPTFKVMTRNDVPPLTDADAWADFPFQDYDLVIIDSMDASTEGVGEKDSSKPSKAIAPLLDIAHRADGPAILVLGNTIKDGAHSRGSGVVEDRADICYEVRDATDLRPSGTKDWWLELAPAGAAAWGERASRRKRRDSYRLAFIATKFRVGEEPDPFVLEIDLSNEPWHLRNVTADIISAGEASRAEVEHQVAEVSRVAVAALAAEVHRRAEAGEEPIGTTDADKFLMEHGLTRSGARTAIKAHDGAHWSVQADASKRGRPKHLRPQDIGSVSTSVNPRSAAEIPPSKSPVFTRSVEMPISADRMNSGRRETEAQKLALTAAIRGGAFPPGPADEPTEEFRF